MTADDSRAVTPDRRSLQELPVRRLVHWERPALAVVVVLVILGVVDLMAHADINYSFVPSFFTSSVMLGGALRTVELALVAQATAAVLGGIVAAMRVSRNPVASSVAAFYTWIFRSIPALVQLLLWFNLALVVKTLEIPIPFTHLFLFQEDTNKGKKKKKKVKEEKKAVAEDESKSMTVIYFPTQKDIDIKAMKAKYPGIDFNAAPPEQMFNSQEYSKQKTKDVQEVLEQSPNLSIAGTGGDVALTCTGISFKGDDAFLKFSIENKSGTDFLTGPMLLTRNGKEGRSITLYPVYISEFPIILPGKEKTIVYATNAIADMSADENFALELNDRFKKTKASVTIPGAIYNKEKQH